VEVGLAQARGTGQLTVVEGLSVDLSVIAQATNRLAVGCHIELQKLAVLGWRGKARSLPQRRKDVDVRIHDGRHARRLL
jgi:hypothetical protein